MYSGRAAKKMSENKDKTDPANRSFSDSAELFESAFREAIDADASKGANAPATLPTGNEPPDKGDQEGNETGTGSRDSEVNKIAVGFWNYLKKDRKETFLDADIKDVNRAILNFLNKDIVGQKIVLLEDEKLRSVNAVARFLKRKRHLKKSKAQKSTIARIRKIYKYLNNPFWRDSYMVGETRKFMEKHSRKMTPSIIHSLNAHVHNLQTYFNGMIFDRQIFDKDLDLKQTAMNLGYREFAVCQKGGQALAKNETGDVLCSDTQCDRGKCPFEACNAHGEEIDFLSRLKELFFNLDIIRSAGNPREAGA